MFLIDPPPSEGDLRFQIAGFPIRIHPFFWISTCLLAMGGETSPGELITWVAVVLVSILVHELGHAFTQRYYGGHPRITLYAFGGLAACDDCDRSPRSQILISLAGPAAGFLLALLLLAVLNLAGHRAGLTTSEGFQQLRAGLGDIVGGGLLGVDVYWKSLGTENANLLVWDLFFVNIYWGAINLLPIYPLDGGQVSREVCTLVGSPRKGITLSLQISIAFGAAVAVYGMLQWHFFLALFFGYLAYSNFRTFQAYRASW